MEGHGRHLITFFTIPKAWRGDDARRQRNAVGSWLAAGARVLLFGDDDGVADAACTEGVEHVPEVTRSVHGTPLLDGVFAEAHRRATTSLLCFANADVIVEPDFTAQAQKAAESFNPVLIVGESWDAAVPHELEFTPGWAQNLPRGRKRGAGALDWFVFTPGLFEQIPPFAVGRAAFDNWLVWRARDLGVPVVDATPSIHVVHQTHDYGHAGGGFAGTRSGAEAAENWRLIGSKPHVYTRFDATHLLTPRGLRRNLGATLRAKERARKVVWKVRHGQVLPARVPR